MDTWGLLCAINFYRIHMWGIYLQEVGLMQIPGEHGFFNNFFLAG